MGIQVTFPDNELGHMQHAFQTLRELMYNQDEEKKTSMIKDFSVYNKVGVDAALLSWKVAFSKTGALTKSLRKKYLML